MAGYQTWTFDTPDGIYVDLVSILMLGSEGGAGGFKMLDARILGTPVDNPTDVYYVSCSVLYVFVCTRSKAMATQV